ncbi:MAG: peptidoglycan-binding domain-containing protein [Caulobacteraceae bacterium]
MKLPMKPLLSAMTVSGLVLSAAAPAMAQGGCVGRVLLPPVEGRRTERVLEAPGRVERFMAPARIERTAHKILVRPAREERVSLPALYRTWHGYQQIAGKPRYEHTAPVYQMVNAQVLVAPGHYVWERRYGAVASNGPPQPGQTLVTPTGEIMCKVWCPARYAVVQRQVMVSPGHVVAVPTTMEREVTKTVLVRPASVQVRHIPAAYRYTYSTRVVAPARWYVRRTAARYGVREIHELHDGGAGWAPVVCGGPLSRPAMAHIQASLNAQGYTAGPADGVGRPETYAALRHFQVDHRLAAGQVTVDSARALGVIQ